MVSGTEEETLKIKIDLCGKKVMANSVMCTKSRSWVHRRCMKTKLLVVLVQNFVCVRCSNMTAGTVTKKKLCDGIEMMKGFYYLDQRLNASGGLMARTSSCDG